jgi:hypothetical protein
MKLDDYSERVLAPMINNLAGDVAADDHGAASKGACPTTSPTWTARAPSRPRPAAPSWNPARCSPSARRQRMAATWSATPSPWPTPWRPCRASSTLRQDLASSSTRPTIYKALNFKWFEDQTVLVHTTGTFSAGTVNGANQTGTNLVTNAITGTLKLGDIITIAGVNAVNRVTKADDGMLQQFVVTANVANAATHPDLPGHHRPQRVTAPRCSTRPCAALAGQRRGHLAGQPGLRAVPQERRLREGRDHHGDRRPDHAEEGRGGRPRALDGLSMRMITAYLPGTDQLATRLDILFGYLFIRPEWCVAIPDHQLGVNPGGEVMGGEIPDHVHIAPDACNRLLGAEEAQALSDKVERELRLSLH